MKRSYEYLARKKSDQWGTPQDLFDDLNKKFKFTCDVCAGFKEIAKCEKYYDEEKNGLLQDWTKDICWMNPPYSDVISWMKKADEESKNGAIVVALTFAKTDSKWFHLYAKHHEIIFLKGRLRFIDFNKNKDHKNNYAPFGCMLTIFRPK